MPTPIHKSGIEDKLIAVIENGKVVICPVKTHWHLIKGAAKDPHTGMVSLEFHYPEFDVMTWSPQQFPLVRVKGKDGKDVLERSNIFARAIHHEKRVEILILFNDESYLNEALNNAFEEYLERN